MNPKPEAAKAGRPPHATARLSREARLKVALKANMARRKAQARAKGEEGGAVRDGKDRTE